jgi:uncharacterized protein (DUF924 family)
VSGEGAAPTGGLAGACEVLAFWRAAGPEKWFRKDTGFDGEVAVRFSALWHAAADGRLTQWEAAPEPALALVIVLDQFPRNIFRDDARSYASDPLARAVAHRALSRGFDAEVAHRERQFFYLPFMHSEAPADQSRCLELARRLADAEFTKYAEEHADIIRRFGRFPHRNAPLARVTTPAEHAFLAAGGFAG